MVKKILKISFMRFDRIHEHNRREWRTDTTWRQAALQKCTPLLDAECLRSDTI